MINVYQDTTKTDDKVSGSNNYTGHILKKTEEETHLSTSAEKYVQKLLYKYSLVHVTTICVIPKTQ